MINRTFIGFGAVFAFLSVALGAFGAHALKAWMAPELLANFQTGVQYQSTHALGLIAIGMLSLAVPSGGHLRRAGWALVIGILLFSGSLYAYSFTGIKTFGAITPIGGVAFLFGWFSLVAAVLSKKS